MVMIDGQAAAVETPEYAIHNQSVLCPPNFLYPMPVKSKYLTPFTRLIGDIAAITGRAVDLIDLKTVGQPLLGQIIKHGLRLVGDDASYGALLSKNAFDHADFYPYRQRILDQRRQAWIGC